MPVNDQKRAGWDNQFHVGGVASGNEGGPAKIRGGGRVFVAATRMVEIGLEAAARAVEMNEQRFVPCGVPIDEADTLASGGGRSGRDEPPGVRFKPQQRRLRWRGAREPNAEYQ